MADISSTLVSNSTQLDNVDLMGGARVFTITGVTVTTGEQPLTISLAEYDRPWKPGLTMRRLLSEMWGAESDAWIGHKVRLYRDETVTFGRTKPGGTRISHASHIEKPVVVTLPTSKGKFGEFKVDPLTDDTPAPQPEHVPDGEPMNDDQRKKLFAQFGELGIKDRDLGLAYMTDVLGREVESSKTLTKQEASQIIESQIADLEARKDNE